jgi:hypothetical protein
MRLNPGCPAGWRPSRPAKSRNETCHRFENEAERLPRELPGEVRDAHPFATAWALTDENRPLHHTRFSRPRAET